MNPLSALDSILTDWASPRVRRLVHSLLSLVAVGAAAVLAADGDWGKAVLALLAALYPTANHANTPVETYVGDDASTIAEDNDGEADISEEDETLPGL